MLEKNPSKYLEAFLDFARQAKPEYDLCKENLNREDELTQDYLHKLELEKLNAVEMTKIAKQIKESRQHRRENKDKIEELEAVINFFEESTSIAFLNKAQQVLGETRRNERKHINRIYHPRVLNKE